MLSGFGDDDGMKGADFIRQRLRQLGLRQEDMAACLHIERTGVSAIVNGKQPLRLAQLEPTAKLLQISVAELLIELGVEPGLPRVDAALLADSMIAVFRSLGLSTEQVDQAASMVATIYEHAARDPGFRQPDGMTSLAGALTAFAQTIARK